jgi:hypothetical protein
LLEHRRQRAQSHPAVTGGSVVPPDPKRRPARPASALRPLSSRLAPVTPSWPACTN